MTHKVWNCGKIHEMVIGQEVTVFRTSTGHTTFGEPANLTKVTTQHLIFTTHSGAIVKTKVNNLHWVVGKADKNRYCVSLKNIDQFQEMIRENVRFWNPKTCTFDKK